MPNDMISETGFRRIKRIQQKGGKRVDKVNVAKFFIIIAFA